MPTFEDWNLLDCTNCALDVTEITLNDDAVQTCSKCNRKVSVHLFPALLRERSGAVGDSAPVIASESSCYYHPKKAASVICDSCGRFLCGLCDIDSQGRHLCTTCMENSEENKTATGPNQRYVQYDTMALILALLGIPFFIVSFITSSVSLYFIIRHWRTPLSILPRNRWRFVLAALISLGTLAGWVIMVVAIIADSSS